MKPYVTSVTEHVISTYVLCGHLISNERRRQAAQAYITYLPVHMQLMDG